MEQLGTAHRTFSIVIVLIILGDSNWDKEECEADGMEGMATGYGYWSSGDVFWVKVLFAHGAGHIRMVLEVNASSSHLVLGVVA